MTRFEADPVGHHPWQRVPLVDLLDRVLGKGVVVSGDLAICIAEVELVRLSLRLLLSSVRADLLEAAPLTAPAHTARGARVGGGAGAALPGHAAAALPAGGADTCHGRRAGRAGAPPVRPVEVDP